MAVSIPSALAQCADGSWWRSFPEEWIGTLAGTGERPKFQCFECGEELTVRCPDLSRGSTYTPNFAHTFGGKRCVMISGGGESKRHALTKRAIEKILQVKKEQDVVLACGHVWQIPVVWDHAEAEKYVPIKDLEKDRKPDIRCSYDGTPVFAVEVHYKNRVDAGKALDYKTINLPWVEVESVDLDVIDVAARSTRKNPRPHIDDLAWVVVGAPHDDKHVLHVENMSFDKICVACREADRKRRIEAWNARLQKLPELEKTLELRRIIQRQAKLRKRRVSARLERRRVEVSARLERRRAEEKARRDAEEEVVFVRDSAVVLRDLARRETTQDPLVLGLGCGHDWIVPIWDRVEVNGRIIACMSGSEIMLSIYLQDTPLMRVVGGIHRDPSGRRLSFKERMLLRRLFRRGSSNLELDRKLLRGRGDFACVRVTGGEVSLVHVLRDVMCEQCVREDELRQKRVREREVEQGRLRLELEQRKRAQEAEQERLRLEQRERAEEARRQERRNVERRLEILGKAGYAPTLKNDHSQEHVQVGKMLTKSRLTLALGCGHEYVVPTWDTVKTHGRTIFCMYEDIVVLSAWFQSTSLHRAASDFADFVGAEDRFEIHQVFHRAQCALARIQVDDTQLVCFVHVLHSTPCVSCAGKFDEKEE